MEFPRPSKSAGDFIGGLKDKLGFGNSREAYDDYDEQPYDEYASYDEANADVFDDGAGYAGEPDPVSDPYDRLRYTTRFSARDKGRSVSANLVNSEDLRAAAIRASQEASRPASPQEDIPAPVKGFDVPATSSPDFVSPYQVRTSSGSSASSYSGSAGLDSLFTPTAPAAPVGGAREISVIEPQSYEDVSSVASSLRKGALVVLALRNTDELLRRRVLDFSFGVASALDGWVERLADKTFVVAKGQKLSNDERDALRAQRLW